MQESILPTPRASLSFTACVVPASRSFFTTAATGGSQRDAGIDDSVRSATGLAVLPYTTGYTIPGNRCCRRWSNASPRRVLAEGGHELHDRKHTNRSERFTTKEPPDRRDASLRYEKAGAWPA